MFVELLRKKTKFQNIDLDTKSTIVHFRTITLV